MGAPKQKWTAEEEAALRAGVEKYGPGKWRAIQKDSKFGPCLTSRSNVDLKDKWRNMSVSANGLGSARKPLASTAGQGMLTLMEDAVSVNPLAVLPPGDDPYVVKRDSADTSGDRKSLGSRYDNMVFEAVAGLKEPYGSSNASIASYIEERHAVPSNFRRLLTTKLKSLALSGKLVKVRQNYKINDGNEIPSPAVEEPEVRERENAVTVSDGRVQKGSRLRRQEVHSDDSNKPHASRFPRELWDLRDSSKKTRPENSMYKKPKMDIEHLAKARAKTAEEAARAAAVAVAEAEAAALAAETAAREAEAAEAEAEALEAAAEAAAAAATRPPKKLRAMAIMQEVAVNG
jgi:myb proto-oncogene protein